MKQLIADDFQLIGLGSFTCCFTYTDEDGYEVCLEPCLNGFDVAIYKNKDLVIEKVCTNIDIDVEGGHILANYLEGLARDVVLDVAIRVANEIYTKFFYF